MFSNFFKKLVNPLKFDIQNPDINLNYILEELINNVWFYCKLLKKKLKRSEPIKDLVVIELDDKILTLIQKRLNRDISNRLFTIKEEFLLNLDINIALFKYEWDSLYTRTPSAKTLWLFYSQQPLHIFTNIFYMRQKNLFKLFNQNTQHTTKNTLKIHYNLKNIYWGFISFLKALRVWLFSLTIFVISFYVLLIKRSCVLPQTFFFWIGLTMLLYWLLSGFVFFVKKYRFSKYTSVIQRFWRRSYILFWLIEGGLLLVFFYLTINSSQESFYMFDQGYFLKTHLFSWKIFVFKCTLVASMIVYSYLLLLNLKWSSFTKNILNLVVITILLVYFVWAEFYQIYWVANFYANYSWIYDVEELAWNLEVDGRRTRILNHYVMILFLLKFWHIVFIFGCWIFFLLRANELDEISYPLYSFNFQNFIILFLMMWLFMYPWFKHTCHWLAEIPYYWFYVDTHVSFYKIFIHDFYKFYLNFFINSTDLNFSFSFNQNIFANWFSTDWESECNSFIKSTLKDELLKKLIKNK